MYDYRRFEETIRILAEGMGGPFAEVAALANQAVARRLEERGPAVADLTKLPPGEAERILRASWLEATVTYFPPEQHEARTSMLTMLFDMMAIDGGGTVPASHVMQ